MAYNPVPKLTNGNAAFNNDLSVSGIATAGSGLVLVDLVPATTTNTLYNDAGTLKFNGAAIGGGGGGSTYTSGSGITIDGDDNIHVYGGSGNFQYIELQTDNTLIPKMKFTGSGVTDTPISLEVASSFESATGSGSALLFQGTQGQLFSITDNLSSGTIFSVSDITGLPMLEIDASGHVQIGEFADDITLHQAVLLSGGVPSDTTNKLYNNAGELYFNGASLGYDDTYVSGIATYASGQVIENKADIVYISGVATSQTLQSITDNGASTTNAITITNNNITASSGLFDSLDMTPLGNGSQPAYQEGVVFYDSENHTLSLYNDEADVTHQLGQEQFLRVRNNTGATIQNGTAVLINGAHGNAAPTISGAIATSEANSQVVGLATHSIEDSSFGYVTTYGIVRDVDTSAFSAGDEIFLSATQIGSGVAVAPVIPNYKISLGHVINSASSNGSILVQVGNPKLGGGDLKSEAPLNMSGVPFVTSVSDTTAGGSQTDPLFIFDSDNRQLQLGSGVQLLDGAPSNTSNVLYNNGGTLSFNGSAVGGGGGTVQGTDGTYDIQPADEGATAGNTRGESSVDLQTQRTAATQVASGGCSVIGGGCRNTASSGFSTISGGRVNTASGSDSTIGGGYCGTTNARYSTIAGGHRNIIQSPTNECCARGATIGGGVGHNSSGGTLSSTTGNLTGTITCCDAGAYSTIAGGLRNCATGGCSTVSGGYNNTASGTGSIVGGGCGNVTSFGCTSIGGGEGNTAFCFHAAVAGGQNNQARGSHSYIGGGYCNTLCGNFGSVISGGYCNTLCNSTNTIGGGYTNLACGTFADTIAGGWCNTASGGGGSIIGGHCNTTSGYLATVGGGCCNITNARHSIIAGGHRNIIQSPTNECCSRGVTIGGGVGHNSSGGTLSSTTGDLTGTITCCDAGAFSTIAGGLRNCATGAYSSIGGGISNTASNGCSTVSGGWCNIASGAQSTIAGGFNNCATGTRNTVGGGGGNNVGGGGNNTVAGGLNNTIPNGINSTIGGGQCNTISGYYSTIGGGMCNTVSGNWTTVGGGHLNTASAIYSTVAGGRCNTASGRNSSVAGGCCNITNARHSIIAGGHRNIIQSPTNECCSRGVTIGGGIGHNSSGGTLDANTGDLTGTITCCNAGSFSTIAGGLRNCATGACSSIGGGCNNTASSYSTISGGSNNTASAYNSTVGGGNSNTASAMNSTVGGGNTNTASGYNSTVSGGGSNTACGSRSTVNGGALNTASGYASTVSGGLFNTASGDTSTVIGGYSTKATKYGEVAHAAGRFAANGDAQHTVLVARDSTTDATANQVLFLDGISERLTIPAETTWMFTVKLAAHNDTDNDGGWWFFRGGIRRDAANNTSLIGTVFEEYSKDSNISSATASVVADDTNEALEIRVTGVASKDIRWVAVVDISQVSWGTP